MDGKRKVKAFYGRHHLVQVKIEKTGDRVLT